MHWSNCFNILNLKEDPTMEFAGVMKVLILVLVLAVPISIVFLVYRTLFSGLNSIKASRDADSYSDKNVSQEHTEGNKPSAKDAV
jgi:hypothetical protein